MKDSINRKIAKLGTGLSLVTSGAIYAQDTSGGIRGGIDGANTGENPADLQTVIQNVIRVLLFIVGTAAVIMLIVGAVRYTVSAGDQQAVANAKNTILYAIVGVIVAVLAWVAVDYVFNVLTGA